MSLKKHLFDLESVGRDRVPILESLPVIQPKIKRKPYYS